MEFAAPEIAEVVSCGKTFKSAAKRAGRNTLRKKVSIGSKQRRSIPTISTKQTSLSRRDLLTNFSRYSCQFFYRDNLLWQETLDRKSQ